MSEHEFHVETSQTEDAVIYRMRGVLGDTHHCHEFNEAFQAALPDAPKKIIFNLDELENIYSAGIGIIASCFTEARKAEKAFVICCANGVVQRSLTLTGVMPLLHEFDTEAEALAATLE